MKTRRAVALGVIFSTLTCVVPGAETGVATAPEVVPETTELPADVAPAVESADFAAVVTEINDLDAAIARLETRSEADSAATAEKLAELASAIEALQEQIQPASEHSGPDVHTSRALDDIQTRLAQLQRVLVMGHDPASTAWAFPRLATILAGVAALLSLVTIVAFFWVRPGGGPNGASIPGSVNRRLKEIHEAVASQRSAPTPEASGQKDDVDAGALLQTAREMRAILQKNEEASAALSDAAERIENTGGSLQAAIESLAAQIKEQEGSGNPSGAAPATNPEEIDALKEQLAAAKRASAAYDGLWPEPFRGDGPLASWKSRLVAAFDKGSTEAGALLAALVEWQRVTSDPDRDRQKWIEAVDTVGRSCLAFLAKEPVPEDTDPIERAQVWTRAFKTLLEGAFPALKLTAVYPGDRFDTDRMEAVGSVSGGRQSVHRAVSWSILEKSDESTQILRRAQVITA